LGGGLSQGKEMGEGNRETFSYCFKSSCADRKETTRKILIQNLRLGTKSKDEQGRTSIPGRRRRKTKNRGGRKEINKNIIRNFGD